MNRKIAGVVLAAAVGACALVGGVERAEALPFYQVFKIVTENNNTFKFQAGPMDTLSTDLTGIVTYKDGIQYRRNADFTDIDGSFQYSITQTAQGTMFDGSIAGVGGNIGVYCENGTCGPLYNDGYYRFSFVTSSTIDYGTSFNISSSEFISSSHNGAVFNDGFDTADFHDLGSVISVSFSLVPVPLPQSVLLFGLGLLALGGFGYVRRRGSVA